MYKLELWSTRTTAKNHFTKAKIRSRYRHSRRLWSSVGGGHTRYDFFPYIFGPGWSDGCSMKKFSRIISIIKIPSLRSGIFFRYQRDFSSDTLAIYLLRKFRSSLSVGMDKNVLGGSTPNIVQIGNVMQTKLLYCFKIYSHAIMWNFDKLCDLSYMVINIIPIQSWYKF